MNNSKINIGDRISVIDDITKGVVVSTNNDLFQVKDNDGFLHFYKANEILKVKDDLFHNIKIKPKEKTTQTHSKQKILVKKETFLEVDLHIHQITHSNKHLSNTDMLQKQVLHAKSKLKFAVKNNIKKIIFIHGKGKGVLKAALLDLLKNYPVKINDASYKKYGQGAMEVSIYKSKL